MICARIKGVASPKVHGERRKCSPADDPEAERRTPRILMGVLVLFSGMAAQLLTGLVHMGVIIDEYEIASIQMFR